MGKSTPQAPVAPDPSVTAEKQAQYNQDTAIKTQLLNMTDQEGPNGSLKYSQTGTNTFVGADGKTYSIPKFTATTTLSPAQQILQGLNNQTQQNLGQIGVDQSAKIGGLLGTNIDLNTATENKIDQLGAARLDPQFARNEDALRTRLANQGIQPGSAAWNAEMTQFGQNKNDAYNQLYLSGRQQGAQEALTERNQPINEISALLSGSQVSMPNFSNTPQTSVAGTDYAGIAQNNFNNQNSIYQTQMAQNNATMGGLFGLGGTIGGSALKYAPSFFALSDRRLKSDVKCVGSLGRFPLYEYDIMGRRERGVMADEVARIIPQAVKPAVDGPLISRFAMVDYSMLEAA